MASAVKGTIIRIDNYYVVDRVGTAKLRKFCTYMPGARDNIITLNIIKFNIITLLYYEVESAKSRTKENVCKI